MRVYLGSDHAGFELKEQVRDVLRDLGHDVVDIGPYTDESVDYPDYAERVGRAVASGEAPFGVLICGTGIGMAIAANKVPGIRAVQASDPEMARMARLHNNANILTLPGRYIGKEQAAEVLSVFLSTSFEGGRHQRRVDKISDIEQSQE
ncbi:MAG: ribose 5-phosphate isomerase B [Coriobacteriia bacterium]|nr:ribose 5-phosphate isomerase B [Coriobacteriia bacterium]MBN2840105.1 ribose 5-phosphate isomerase B [Coriobacteriia bacterium]